MKNIRTAIKNKRNLLRAIPPILIVLLSGFLVRLFLANFGTLTIDQNTFIAWSQRLSETGFKGFYSGWSDYLPGYLYILFLLGKINSMAVISPTILYKLPAILADLGATFLIYKVLKKLKNEKMALIGAAIYLFNPAVLGNSTLWGQVDSVNSLFSILSIFLLPINPILSAITLAIGTAVKPQAALTAVVIFILMIKNRYQIKKIVTYILVSALTFMGIFLPFYSGNSNFIGFIIERISSTLNQYPYTSVNAFNFWGLSGLWRTDIGLNIVGIIILITLFFIFTSFLLKKKGSEYYLLSVIYGLSFLFMTRMHERHLLPIFAPLTIISILEPFLLISLVGLSVTYVLNLYYSFVWINENFRAVFNGFMVSAISSLNIILLFLLAVPAKLQNQFIGFLESRKLKLKTKDTVDYKFEKPKISSRNIRIIFITVVVFAFVTRIFNLGNPPNEYFDEVYHAFTAKHMLEGNPKAWEWWNPNPTGFAYEWTHPPVAKEGMVIGMLLFGENAFGYRLPGALLGVGSVILIFFICKELFNDELMGVLASAVFALDGLTLVMSRIGMNDSYILFFALASFLLFIKNKNFFSALCLGLALSSKWSALWLIPILFVAHFALKKKIKVDYVWFMVLPPLVYLASYIPMFTTGHTWANFIEVQKQMWWYHTRLHYYFVQFIFIRVVSQRRWSLIFMQLGTRLFSGGDL